MLPVSRSKPPLARRPPRPLSHASKQPDIDWDGALQHFSVCVRQDLHELNERFVKENVISFSAWKLLWREMNMSAAFHVEFWESTPTFTHKAILQEALDGLVSSIELNGEFQDAIGIASLIGRVFALYCAYSLQLGDPKHKIDVDPQGWTALLSINCVMIGLGVTLFPSAVREVRAMMYRLAIQENAFLGCLQGFGACVSVTGHMATSRKRFRTHDGLLAIEQDAAEDGLSEAKQVDVQQLQVLSYQYQELSSWTQSTAVPASTGSIRVGERRGKTNVPGPSLSARLVSRGEDNAGQKLAHALASYLIYKANEGVRKARRAARVAATQDVRHSNVLDLDYSELDDNSIGSMSPSGMSAPESTRSRAKNSRRGSGDSEYLLAELESELHANIINDTAKPFISVTELMQRQDNGSSVLSQVSQADSDGFAALELVPEQDIEIESSRKENAPVALEIPSISYQKDSQNSHVIPASRKPVRTRKQARQDIVDHPGNKCAAERTRSVSRLSANPWAVCSTADSDGLADLQDELDSLPFFTAQADDVINPPSAITVPNGGDAPTKTFPPQAKIKKPAIQKRRAEGRATGRRHTPNLASKCTFQGRRVCTVPQRHELIRRPLSAISDSSDLVAELNRELNLATAPVTLVASGILAGVRTATAVNHARLRRSSRLSSVTSDSGSNALLELEKELSRTASALATFDSAGATENIRSNRVPAARKRTSLQASGSKRPARQAEITPGTAKKMRLNDGIAEKSNANSKKHAQALQTRSSACGRTRISQAEQSSDTESDALSELVAELDTSVAAPTYTMTPCEQNRSKVAQAQSTLVRSRAEAREPQPVRFSTRRSVHLNSKASETESNGLEDLLAELERGSPVFSSDPSQRKPTKQVATKLPNKTPSATRKALQHSYGPINLLSAKRSVQSSSDGLVDLEAELQS